MINFDKILVPVDGSDSSRAVLKYAVNLALPAGAEVIVLHIVPARILASVVHAVPLVGSGTMHNDVIEYGRSLLDGFADVLQGVRTRFIVREGETGDSIIKAAQEEAVDVIVMATHERSNLARFVLGSTTDQVVRAATVPVLTLTSDVLSRYDT